MPVSGDVHIAYQVVGHGPIDLVFSPSPVSNLGYGSVAAVRPVPDTVGDLLAADPLRQAPERGSPTA